MSPVLKPGEPIAIVGSSCRFPGDVASPSQLWELLRNPQDLSREVPLDRFNVKAFYHPNGKYHGTTNSPKAYWLSGNPASFDASFFQINPKEAEALDPQQRLLLEVVYEAMEAAGFSIDQYSGENVGVFSGCMTTDYEGLSARDPLTTSEYHSVGNSRAVIANRISYWFNFRGPSLCLDTACSSGLVGLHLAVQNIRDGHCTAAVVTGTNLMITPDQFIVESALGLLSPTGKCHMWDTRADGYARGEGIAALIVKPLSQALADGDQIEAVIREIGSNADGKTGQLTEPNPEAQAELIRNTYVRAGLDPKNPKHHCQYFEAHGTGTQAGDPRESSAINNAFFGDSNDDQDNTQMSLAPANKMLVGSIKTVIGHTEATAGLAGVLKVVASLKHGLIAPNLHFDNLNPSVKPFYTHLEIPTTLTTWPTPPDGHPRRASVNSFGFGGANAHVIIEAYTPEIHGPGAANRSPATQAGRITDATGGLATQFNKLKLTNKQLNARHYAIISSNFQLPIVLSAASPKSLRDVCESYHAYLRNNAVDPVHLAWHLYSHRSDLPHRLVIPSTGSQDLIVATLGAVLKENETTIPDENHGRTITTKSPLRILGIFTGQGAQWATMSRELLVRSRVYRNTIRKLDLYLQKCPQPCTWTLEKQIKAEKGASRVGEAAVSQPLCTAVQIALIDFLRSIGIGFHTVVGHSSGEMAAAYAAGRLSARDAIVISYYRGLVAHISGSPTQKDGRMCAANMPEDEALEFCESDPAFRGRISVAASNSPNSVTLSGDLDAVTMAYGKLMESNKSPTMLRVDTAYHSHHMAQPAAHYIKLMQEYGVSPLSGGNDTIWISSVEGRSLTEATDLDCQYWADNMVNRVQFRGAVEYALSQYGDEYDCVVEVGPHPALRGPFSQTLVGHDANRNMPYMSPLNRSFDSDTSVSNFLGSMWARYGVKAVDMRSYIEQSEMTAVLSSRIFNLPAYPFDHSVAYWRESRISRRYHNMTEAPHELLGFRCVEDSTHELKWRNILKVEQIPWLSGHKFQGQALLPASAYCVMALDAARSYLAGRPASVVELYHVEIYSGIAIDEGSSGVETLFRLTISPDEYDDDGVIEATFELYSCVVDTGVDSSNAMRRHASGSMYILLGKPSMSALPSRQAPQSETLPADPDSFYKMMKSTGLDYTGPFKALTSVNRRFEYCCSTLNRTHADETTALKISPATLDACFQPAFLAFAAPGDGSLWTTFLPTRIGAIHFNLAVLEGDTAANPQDTLTVDTYINNCSPPNEDTKAEVAVDAVIYNEAGEAEIQVEHLIVRAWAHTNPKDDVEMYLHTVMHLDPIDGVEAFPVESVVDEEVLDVIDDSRRIASIFLHSAASQNGTLTTDDQDMIDEIISTSLHADFLDMVVEEASQMDVSQISERLSMIDMDVKSIAFNCRTVGRIVQQIAHRFPQMNVLQLARFPDLDRSTLYGLGDSFQSLIVRKKPGLQAIEGAQERDINLDRQLATQLGHDVLLDLVILSTTLLNHGSDPATCLDNISSAMKPGGFLILFAPYEPAPYDDDSMTSTFSTTSPDCLAAYGFVNRGSVWGFTDCYVHLYQNHKPGTKTETDRSGILTDTLLILHGALELNDDELVHGLRGEFHDNCNKMISCSLDDASTQDLQECTAVIMLADLDEPVMSNMTEHRMNQLRTLLRPGLTVLWLTRDAVSGNPEHAASFGFIRTIMAEVEDLTMQVVDLELSDSRPKSTITTAFLRLMNRDIVDVGNKPEPEIHMKNGLRYIPRFVPWKAGNKRVNAMRRIVVGPLNTLRHRVQVFPVETLPFAFRLDVFATEVGRENLGPDDIGIQVEYSSSFPQQLNDKVFGYVCVGKELATNQRMLAFSSANESHATCKAKAAMAIPEDAPPSAELVSQLVRYLAAARVIVMSGDSKPIILIYPDVGMVRCLLELVAAFDLGWKITIVEPCYNDAETSPYINIGIDENNDFELLRLHPRTSVNDLKRALPGDAVIFDFLDDNNLLTERIGATVPYQDKPRIFRRLQLTCLQTPPRLYNGPVATKSLWGYAITAALKPNTSPSTTTTTAVSVDKLRSSFTMDSLFRVLSWKLNPNIMQQIRHTTDEQLLFPHKTYFLFGLTRDIGQSLCRLFLNRGAKHIVLASRNPPTTSPHWVVELNAEYDADIRIERADVTSLDSLKALRETIAGSTPLIIGGVVNGAMVLEDRSFSEMSIETWHRVLSPKTIGSKNLDLIFGSGSDIDFFIMTSSFAAVGGHAGQSNYAAANAYMNGLAAYRRRNNLPGTALNIGVIYGLGFLQREREDLYGGLERDGYPPISERDLHHMFLEAIVTGRPSDKSGPGEITTGLRRYRRGLPHPPHWTLDLRFSHFALRHGDADDKKNGDAGAGSSLLEELAAYEDAAVMADIIAAAFETRLRALLGLPEGSAIDRRLSPVELGLDSITAVEILRWFSTHVGKGFALIKIMDAPSIKKLCLDAAEQVLKTRAEAALEQQQ
ncbi:hypothetical protein F4808DRAFT_473921 [Astrocystis sublimbata]|nr:hypothetical protein F4808DRAFT_473921 [Astrocystis sublimbata]